MRQKLRGFVWALFTLIALYLIGVLWDGPDGDADVSNILATVVIACIFSTAVLFIVVLPQTLFAKFIARRFGGYAIIPFILFIGISSLLVSPVALWYSDGKPLFTFAWWVGYLFAGCIVLWCISFRRENAV